LTGRISRDHSVKTVEVGDGQAFPVLSLVGGKWTTFRAFAEQTADRVLDRVGQTRQVSTDNMPIGGGRDYPESDTGREGWLEDLQTATNLPHERLETLFERYGTRAREMATYITNGTDEALRHQPDASRREIAFLAINEKVEHLDDVLLRRSSLAMLGYVTPELLDEIAVVVGEVLGWTDKQTRQEIERTRAILMDKHGVRLGEVSKISADSAKKP
jgi:glycerol-3-phosphate dehydrogenase